MAQKNQTAIPLPAGTKPFQVNWRYAVVLTLVHLLALLAFLPAYFSWLGVACLVAGYFLFGMCGATIGYHRLLTHRSFRCSKAVEYTLAVLGICCLQESPTRWVAIHRLHHRHADRQPDPHSPLARLIWGYAGWLFVINRDHWYYENYTRQARDLMRQPFYAFVETYLMALWIYVLHAGLFFGLGWTIGWYTLGDSAGAIRLGTSAVVWGVFARTVVVLHLAWSVNAFCHLRGYRNYDTPDNSRNNWLFAIVGYGDGWHNNHHARQRWAAHGHKAWEVDISYAVICLLERLHLAYDVIHPQTCSGTSDSPHNAAIDTSESRSPAIRS
ncbi:MAG: acyl-CoA desaturase [Planctomycetota bacterium]|nr:acyl-CoA desaturase [Planctomycetota bacterium]